VKKSFDAMVEAEATFKADLEKLLKSEGHMPEDKFLVMSRKGKRLGVAFASTRRPTLSGRTRSPSLLRWIKLSSRPAIAIVIGLLLP
jgi:hypothetical protein